MATWAIICDHRQTHLMSELTNVQDRCLSLPRNEKRLLPLLFTRTKVTHVEWRIGPSALPGKLAG